MNKIELLTNKISLILTNKKQKLINLLPPKCTPSWKNWEVHLMRLNSEMVIHSRLWWWLNCEGNKEIIFLIKNSLTNKSLKKRSIHDIVLRSTFFFFWETDCGLLLLSSQGVDKFVFSRFFILLGKIERVKVKLFS